MRKFLNPDSPLMIFLSNLTDIVVLNVLCFICCLPIITVGPAVTAMHYITLKIARDEEIYVLRDYMKAFKENFKQSILAWLVFLVITAVFFLDYVILKDMGLENTKVFLMIIGAIYLLICFTMMYVFPLMARFENPLKQTVKNAFLMSILHIFKTVIMAVIYAIPFALLPLHYNVLMFFLLVGLSGPAYFNSFIWKSIFKKYEPEKVEEEITDDMDFQIPEE